MALNSRFNVKAKDANPLNNDGCVIVYGTVNSAVSAAYNKDLTGRDEPFSSNGRIKNAATTGEQGQYSAYYAKASDSIGYFNRYDGTHLLITTITTTIGGLSKSQLQFAGNIKNKPILYRETRRTQQTNGLTRDYVTGDYTTSPSVVLDEFKQLGGTLSDDAAHPSRSVPGEFVIIIADGNDPELRDYQPRTG